MSTADVEHRTPRVLPGLMLVMLLGALDQTIMSPALPAVAVDLGGLDLMPAVLTAYLAAATAVMPLYGKLGDRYGRKPVLLVAIGVFVVGAALCGTAQAMPALLAFRVLQGAGGGGLMIGAQAVIGEVVSPRERGRYLGLLGAAYVVAGVGGPLMGGLAVDHVTWRWIFALHPPLGLLAFVVVTRALHLPPPLERPPFDSLGALTLSTTVLGVVVFSSTVQQAGPWPAWLAPTAAATTVIAGIAWVWTARTAADPLLPLRLFRDRSFAIPAAISFLVGFALFGTISYLPAFLQIARGATATEAGLVVTVLMAGVITTVTASGRAIARTGRYKLFPVVGAALAAVGLALLGSVDRDVPTAMVLAYLLVIGLGVGLVMQVMVLVAQNGVAYRDLGATTSAVTFLRQIGASSGVAVVGAVLTARVTARLPAGAGVDQAALDPERLAQLPAEVRVGVATAFGEAVPPIFAFVAPLLGLAFLLAIALPAVPLRSSAHVDTGRTAP
ncbi:MAG TPA: MFS transporter [Geodermatophilus sp.]|nr:MFS transporter [Geodermatophilus sp.]